MTTSVAPHGSRIDRSARVIGTLALGDGHRVTIRFIRPDDAARLIELFDALTPETVYRRFLHARAVLPPSEAARYAGVDGRERDALVACVPKREGTPSIVGVARYAKQGEEAAEGGLVVADAYQSRGLGTALLHRLIGLLRFRGFRYLRGSVLPENGRMLRLLRSTGRSLRIARDDGVYQTELDLAAAPCRDVAFAGDEASDRPIARRGDDRTC